MTSKEFRNLQHGDKINGPDGINFIVHNNHRSGSGMVVATRTEIIFGRDCNLWNIAKKHEPVNVVLPCGIYQVRIDHRIDGGI